MPRRSTSKREAKVAIISIAQQASPKVTGHTEDLRAQLRTASATPVADEAAREVEDALGGALEERGVLVALRALLVDTSPTPAGP